MKNFIRVMAGFLIAILAVLIVIGLYNKGIAGKLGWQRYPVLAIRYS